MQSLLLKSYTRKAETNELWFLERGAEAHEWYYIARGGLRPQRAGWHLIGSVQDECEADAFIDFCEEPKGLDYRVKLVYVRYSYANFKKYHRTN